MSLPWTRHDYLAVVTDVIDGDTVEAIIELGLFGITCEARVRLLGIDAPERGDPEGPAATAHLSELLGGREVRLRTSQRPLDSFGRVLAWLWPVDAAIGEPSLNQRMIDDGFAAEYLG